MGVSAIFGGNRYLVPFNWGIATPVCGLVRNDRNLEGEATNTNLESNQVMPNCKLSIVNSFPLDFPANPLYNSMTFGNNQFLEDIP